MLLAPHFAHARDSTRRCSPLEGARFWNPRVLNCGAIGTTLRSCTRFHTQVLAFGRCSPLEGARFWNPRVLNCGAIGTTLRSFTRRSFTRFRMQVLDFGSCPLDCAGGDGTRMCICEQPPRPPLSERTLAVTAAHSEEDRCTTLRVIVGACSLHSS